MLTGQEVIWRDCADSADQGGFTIFAEGNFLSGENLIIQTSSANETVAIVHEGFGWLAEMTMVLEPSNKILSDDVPKML